MQTLQKSSFTLVLFSKFETNTQYSIIEIKRDDAKSSDLSRVGDVETDAGALIVVSDTNHPYRLPVQEGGRG